MPNPLKFIIVPMAKGRMGFRPILPVKVPVTIDTMFSFHEQKQASYQLIFFEHELLDLHPCILFLLMLSGLDMELRI